MTLDMLLPSTIRQALNNRRKEKKQKRYERRRQIDDRAIEDAVHDGRIGQVQGLEYYTGSDVETLLGIYEHFVTNKQWSFATNDFLSRSLKEILKGREDLLRRWGAALVNHNREGYGVYYEVEHALFTPQGLEEVPIREAKLDALVERLMHCGSVEAGSILAFDAKYGFNHYHGKDLTTLITLATNSGRNEYARSAMRTDPKSLSLAKLLLKEFTNADGTPHRGLYGEVTGEFLSANLTDANAVDAFVFVYLQATKQPEALLDLAEELQSVGHRQKEDKSGLPAKRLSLRYSFHAAQIALEAARLSGEKPGEALGKALDAATSFFSTYLYHGGSISEVPELVVEHVILCPKKGKDPSEDVHVYVSRDGLNDKLRHKDQDRYWRIFGRLFPADVHYVGEDFGQQPSNRQPTNFAYDSAVTDLGLEPGKKYSPEQLKTAWKQAIFRSHPDRNNAPGAREAAKKVNNAYRLLKENGFA